MHHPDCNPATGLKTLLHPHRQRIRKNYNYDTRLYDPVTGLFVMTDTIISDVYHPQSLNRYAYCLNNPLKYVDPTGHFEEMFVFDYYDFPIAEKYETFTNEYGSFTVLTGINYVEPQCEINTQMAIGRHYFNQYLGQVFEDSYYAVGPTFSHYSFQFMSILNFSLGYSDMIGERITKNLEWKGFHEEKISANVSALDYFRFGYESVDGKRQYRKYWDFQNNIQLLDRNKIQISLSFPISQSFIGPGLQLNIDIGKMLGNDLELECLYEYEKNKHRN